MILLLSWLLLILSLGCAHSKQINFLLLLCRLLLWRAASTGIIQGCYLRLSLHRGLLLLSRLLSTNWLIGEVGCCLLQSRLLDLLATDGPEILKLFNIIVLSLLLLEVEVPSHVDTVFLPRRSAWSLVTNSEAIIERIASGSGRGTILHMIFILIRDTTGHGDSERIRAC